MADLSDVAVALVGLKPIGQWFLAHSVMTAVLVWIFHDTHIAHWPGSVMLALDAWFIASMVVAGIVSISGIASLGFELHAWNQARTESRAASTGLPEAPKPAPKTGAGSKTEA